MFVWHQEQAEGEEPDVHQADSVCDWGPYPGAWRSVRACSEDLDSECVTDSLRWFDIDITGKVGQNPQSQATQTGQ